jgi:UDP-glucose 4-epimerase
MDPASIPSGKRILITGGAGFIGSTLAGLLCESNQLVLFDNLTRNSLQYSDLANHPNVTLLEGDVRDAEQVLPAMEGCDLVVHAAAVAGIDTVIKNPVNTMEINMLGTANVLRAAMRHKVSDRVVCFSTSEVFGSMAYRVNEETQTVSGSAGEARWVYAVSKLAGEHLAVAYHKQFGLPTVTLRPFNVYGPGQTGEGALHNFVKRALVDEDLFIYGDGTQIRAWCYVDDMVEGLLLAMTSPAAIGESFNIGNQRAVLTIFGLAETVCRVLDSRSTIHFREPLSADIELRIPDTRKALDKLGFRAQVDLEEGIRRTADWLRTRRSR